MDIKTSKPNLTDVLRVYVISRAGSYVLSPLAMRLTIDAEVVGIYTGLPVVEYILGWPFGSQIPQYTSSFNGIIAGAGMNTSKLSTVKNINSFIAFAIVDENWEIDSVVRYSAMNKTQIAQNVFQQTIALGNQMTKEKEDFFTSQKNIIQQQPCKISSCSRMNDTGVKSCWWCGVSSPNG